MGTGTTLDEIELKRDDFADEEQERRAFELLEEWPVSFTDLAQLNDDNWRKYQDVYETHMGPPGSDYTVKEIRAIFESVENYVELRSIGLAGLFAEKATGGKPGLEKAAMRSSADPIEAFRDGHSSGIDEGWNMALEAVKRDGLENVSVREE